MDINLLRDIEKLTKEKSVREIYLFGSVAREEQDEYSDIDILIVIDDCSEEEYFKLKDRYAYSLNVPVSWLSVYRNNKIMKMYANGSYFLWHIKKEGKVLYSRDGELANLLLTLPRYTNVGSDLKEYDEILADIKCELDNECISINYELAVLASLVRNTCIAISYLNGRLDFGRNSVVLYCFSEYNFNVSPEEYKELYRYRLYHTGKVNDVPDGEIGCLKKWIKIESDLLEVAKRGVKEYEKKVVSGMG
ncbi:hypothetical protein D7V94_18260 [Parablautia intestinalis]|uniref:Polymerase beta nucleotidyltransferase domain-containing protein n=1 Tax=Parablautia intestinalis TaxID=2320100 RepID=A0A3A9ADR5_9FIRM|nr:nucleotidyltransferase domain-containing protein [Parablautia intestinalis]MCI8616100.1 hypothetical protein [Lachnospiraceae bacterium]RKI89398.1 hypothetical protein D7V94_18260 [Parablautia intestinalis]